MPAVRHVVAGRRDAAVPGIAEEDAGGVGAHGEQRLVGERAQHLLQLERRVEGARGAHERVVVGGAGRLAALGVEPREPGGGNVGKPFDEPDLLRA